MSESTASFWFDGWRQISAGVVVRMHVSSQRLNPPRAGVAALPAHDSYHLLGSGHRITRSGATLYVRETPEPVRIPKVVYLHGLGASGTTWDRLAPLLSPHAPGWAIDFPGSGRSRPLPSGQCTPAAYAQAVLSFLAESPEPIHLIGHSLGALVALMIATEKPELIRSLTLISPALPTFHLARTIFKPQGAVSQLTGAIRLPMARTPTPLERAKRMMELCSGDPSKVPEERTNRLAEEIVERDNLPWWQDSYRRTRRALLCNWLHPWRLWSEVSRVTSPTLVVSGGRDRIVPPEVARRAALLLPVGKLLHLPQAGHIPHVDQPMEVAQAIVAMWQPVRNGQ